MKHWPLILVLAVLLMAARSERAVTLQAGDTAHCTADALVLTSAVDARCVAFTPTPTTVAVATATSTGTPVPTATATATATATTVPTLPAGMPLCPSHDPTVYHALIDTARGCHYDHEHGDNPNLADAVFGLPAAAWGGQTVSWPWATSAMENGDMAGMGGKHGGYKWAVLLNQPCIDHPYEGYASVNCIKDARIEFHIVAASLDGLARYHSYYIEYNICAQPAYTQCGVLRIGGWADFGVLNVPYAGTRVYRPGGTIDFGLGSLYGGNNAEIIMSFPADATELDQIAPVGAFPCCDEPYVSLPPSDELSQPGGFPQQVWSMNNIGSANHFGHNIYARFSERISDSWDGIDTANVNTPHFFFRDGNSPYNGSLRELSETSAFIPAAWDADADGFADISGFTDRYGNPVSGCTVLGVDCVPFSAVHVPVGAADTEDSGCECNRRVEYDTSLSGQHWIRFPN